MNQSDILIFSLKIWRSWVLMVNLFCSGMFRNHIPLFTLKSHLCKRQIVRLWYWLMGFSHKSEVLLKYPWTKYTPVGLLKRENKKVHLAPDIGHFKGHNTRILVYFGNLKSIERCCKNFDIWGCFFKMSDKLEFTSVKESHILHF